MNFASLFSFVIAAAVFVGAVLASATNWRAFVNLEAALVVFGGTMAAAAISFQVDRLWIMFKVFFHRIIRGRKTDFVPLIREMMVLADLYRMNSPELPRVVQELKDPFLKEGMQALVEKFPEEQDLFRLLSTRAQTIAQRYHQEAVRMKAIAKFPPAFGLMGATLGMISLLETIGTREGQANIGPAMAVALVGTLYGIAFANMVLVPISEQLLDSAAEIHVKNRIIVEGLKHISSRKNPLLIAEELNSFLLASERIDRRSLNRPPEKKNEAA
ncbi:MAG: MotA/TolQ/ExbB proton channel family protein [Bdellovibrionota bacterium]